MHNRPPIGGDDELLRAERELRAEGFSWIAGVDEAGRGPLAGPVSAAAVVLPEKLETLPQVNDSKKLSASAREKLFEELYALPGIQISAVLVDASEIDRINILQATHEAMRRAVSGLEKVDFVLVDGLPVRGFPVPCRNVIKGDAKCAAIAAASIIAKVTRDRWMTEAAKRYPEYGFEIHKGYGTAAHLAALRKYGPCPLHRRSFRPVAELLPGFPVQGELEI